MDALRAVFVAAGYPDAVTHIQTGNVIFTPTDGEDITREKIERQIHDDLGLSIVTMLRTGGELAVTIAKNPFVAISADPTQLYVAFLSAEPAGDDLAVFSAMQFGDDEFVVVGRDVFLRYSERISQSKLTSAVIEKKLRRSATVRNWAVATKLAELSR